MPRPCTICSHKDATTINKRLVKGESATALAAEYDVPMTTIYRHRKNCAGLAAAETGVLRERTRATVALASLPSREELGAMYRTLGDRIDQIVAQAEAKGSLAVAVTGLNSLRQTFDSMGRFAGFDSPSTQVNVNVAISADAIAASLAKAIGGKPPREIEAIVCEPVPAAPQTL